MNDINAAIPDELVLADLILPADIVRLIIAPRSGAPRMRSVLVTGATGFLGRYLVATLLGATTCDVVCLVRGHNKIQAQQRLLKILESAGVDVKMRCARLRVVCGDVSQHNFGLERADYSAIAGQVDTVFHCAAEVNWVKSYAGLRQSNVLGTVQVIRFACHEKTKPLHFISTMAVCYPQNGPEHIDESTDMLPYLSSMPLGYAQSKCVAEALLAQVAARGLPVTVIRPSLICGDTVSGVSNEDDLISRLLKGCVRIGGAADVDWCLDICPVDYVARNVVAFAVSEEGTGHRVLHIHHPQPRHWREVVLWMNLIGYALPLLDFEEWLSRLAAATRQDCPELFSLRPFFLSRSTRFNGHRKAELYLESMRQRICSERSHQLIAAQKLGLPPIDALLMTRYLRRYRSTGFLPSTHVPLPEIGAATDVSNSMMQSLLRQSYGESLQVTENQGRPCGSNSILNELSVARCGQQVGIWNHRVSYSLDGHSQIANLDLLVKIKSTDTISQEIADVVAKLHGDKLHALAHYLPQALGSVGAHRRELAIYRLSDERLERHRPKVYATLDDTGDGRSLVAMEYLRNVDMLDSTSTGIGWTHSHIHSAIDGLAQIHAFGYRKDTVLSKCGWLTPDLTLDKVREMNGFWHALVAAAAPEMSRHCADWEANIARQLVDTMPTWWRQMKELPRTLIHNDFNPRNLAFRRTDAGLRLCAYDWELATLGLPQHDLAELLCFVLPADADATTMHSYIERHRLCLQHASGFEIDALSWLTGFKLSLQNFLVCRLSMYALMERFSPQSFFPKTINNWHRLFRWQKQG